MELAGVILMVLSKIVSPPIARRFERLIPFLGAVAPYVGGVALGLFLAKFWL
jgi:hypothetical protein